jgi:hypothetical protein
MKRRFAIATIFLVSTCLVAFNTSGEGRFPRTSNQIPLKYLSHYTFRVSRVTTGKRFIVVNPQTREATLGELSRNAVWQAIQPPAPLELINNWSQLRLMAYRNPDIVTVRPAEPLDNSRFPHTRWDHNEDGTIYLRAINTTNSHTPSGPSIEPSYLHGDTQSGKLTLVALNEATKWYFTEVNLRDFP